MPDSKRYRVLLLYAPGLSFSGLYVNSWGRDKEQIIASRVGVKAPARFLCTTEEDSVSEIAEVTHSKTDSFQDFGFVVAAFNKAV